MTADPPVHQEVVRAPTARDSTRPSGRSSARPWRREQWPGRQLVDGCPIAGRAAPKLGRIGHVWAWRAAAVRAEVQ